MFSVALVQVAVDSAAMNLRRGRCTSAVSAAANAGPLWQTRDNEEQDWTIFLDFEIFRLSRLLKLYILIFIFHYTVLSSEISGLEVMASPATFISFSKPRMSLGSDLFETIFSIFLHLVLYLFRSVCSLSSSCWISNWPFLKEILPFPIAFASCPARLPVSARLSPRGRSFTFDASADGYGRGEGSGDPDGWEYLWMSNKTNSWSCQQTDRKCLNLLEIL